MITIVSLILSSFILVSDNSDVGVVLVCISSGRRKVNDDVISSKDSSSIGCCLFWRIGNLFINYMAVVSYIIVFISEF